jgi:putative endopeptidase
VGILDVSGQLNRHGKAIDRIWYRSLTASDDPTQLANERERAGLSAGGAYRAAMRMLPAGVRLVLAAGICVGASAVGPRAAALTGGPLPEPFDARAVDRHANACTNFFDFATGAYRRAHPIPPAYAEYGYIEQLEDRTRDIVRDIVVRAQRMPAAPGSDTQKIGTLYGTCMDTRAIERHGLAPAAGELARIDALAQPADLPAEIARLHALGVDAGFALNAAPDIRDSSTILAQIDQGGLGLPDRDYYMRADAESRKLRAQYAAYVATLLRLSGDAAAAADARAAVALETRFARGSTAVADLRAPEVSYHPMTVDALTALAPHGAFKHYLHAFGLTPRRVNVAEPVFVRTFDRSLSDTPLTVWKSYLRWRLLDAFAPALPARFEDASFAFHGHILNGAQANLPRWKRCVNSTNLLLGEAVGRAYVARVFSPTAKARALAMTERIKRAYRAEMQSLAWMTPATKGIALAKLDAMGLKVGYPAKWRDYSAYSVRNDSYFANVARGQTFAHRYELAKIGRAVDRAEWSMSPQTVNAYNDTQRNEIVLPAAQLQRPFYDPNGEDTANLGATGGGTVGHEMTHGFDDEGHKFDARGNVKNWWTPRDLRAFDARANCVIRQFDRSVAVGSVHYQGRLVAGEAIADLGGVVIGYRALEDATGTPALRGAGGFSAAQRYFLAYAQSWAEEIRPEAARTEALGDPHPLPRDRVNLTLANVPAWYAAFDCPPPARPICQIW